MNRIDWALGIGHWALGIGHWNILKSLVIDLHIMLKVLIKSFKLLL